MRISTKSFAEIQKEYINWLPLVTYERNLLIRGDLTRTSPCEPVLTLKNVCIQMYFNIPLMIFSIILSGTSDTDSIVIFRIFFLVLLEKLDNI